MKVLAFSGSLRAASVNTALLKVAARLVPEGMELVRYTELGGLPLFNPDLDPEALPVVARLRAQATAADALLIASPEYAHGITGAMKNALDWLVGCEAFVDKPVAIFNTGPRSHHAHDALREIATVMSARVVEAASVAVPLANSRVDEAAIAADLRVCRAVAAALSALAGAVR